MIISRTPYRLSFFGDTIDGHTCPTLGSAVLATTINHYCYLQCRPIQPFFEHHSRIVWSKIEEVMAHNQIQHPAVKAVLDYLHIDQGVEIHHQGDLPARSGLGASSAFTVGLLHALYALRGMISSKRELACESIHIERDILKENVSVYDQIETAYGGLNKIVIRPDGNFEVIPLILSSQRLQELQDHLLLFFTGLAPTAETSTTDKIKPITQKNLGLHEIQQMVEAAENILCSQQDICHFGELLHESWQLKRQLNPMHYSEFTDEVYERSRQAGAIGGKLLGRDGSGFMLIFAPPQKRTQVFSALKDLLWVPFKFETSGSQIIFYDQQQFDEKMRRDYVHLRQTLQESGSREETHGLRLI